MLARQGPHGLLVHDVNTAAAQLGIARSERITDMRALVPQLQVENADEKADASDLASLAEWCRRWCPWTRAHETDGLLLDTTGSDHLWGGEHVMLADMRATIAGLGLTARIAIAPTIGSAWALARYGRQQLEHCPPEDTTQKLAPLPVAALRLDQESVILLRRLGLKTIGALQALPRQALIRRFRKRIELEKNPVVRLDQAMGRIAEPLVAGNPQTPFRALQRLAEPVAEIASVAPVVEQLARQLCDAMEKRATGARRLRLAGYRADGGVAMLEAATSRASHEPAHLAGLFAEKLETLDAGFGFDAIGLEVLVAEEFDPLQKDLSGEADKAIDLARLVDRLAARLGPAMVAWPVAGDSHLPERAGFMQTTGQPGIGGNEMVAPLPGQPVAPRPIRLLPKPEEAQVIYALPDGPPAQFVWRRKTHRIARSQGPERIAPEWWREKAATRLRDYYRIEDHEGRRYWIFREGLTGDGRGTSPRWFIHGFDA